MRIELNIFLNENKQKNLMFADLATRYQFCTS